jgi:hypothetical protein
VERLDVREQVLENIKELRRVSKIFEGLIARCLSAEELGAAVGAAGGMASTIDRQAKILMALEGLIGNINVDARSLTINQLPEDVRAALRKEVEKEIIDQVWAMLPPDAQDVLARRLLGRENEDEGSKTHENGTHARS